MTDRKRILLVEDNPDDVELTLRAFRLSQTDAEVEVACDGADAIDALLGDRRLDTPLPAVVLLDLKLPRVDGLGVLRRLRAEPRTALLPVVILTSSLEAVDLADSYRLGANSFVRKPIAFGDLVETIRRLGLYWLGVNEGPVAVDLPLPVRRL